ncbi:MAG: sporulation protein YqfD [Bacillota bacterium]
MRFRLKPSYFTGVLTVDSYGKDVTMVLEKCCALGLTLKNVSYVSEGHLAWQCSPTAFKEITAIADKCNVKLFIRKKEGIIFVIKKIWQRPLWIALMTCAVVALGIVSSFIFSIEIQGIKRLREVEVSRVLKQEGVYAGRCRFMLPDLSEVGKLIVRKLPEVAWAGLKRQGTHLVVTIVEKKRPVPITHEIVDHGQVDLMAAKPALIHSFQVKRGKTMVELGDTVERGDLLISGQYTLVNNEDEKQTVGACGRVLGVVWYEGKLQFPLSYTRKILTGRSKKVNGLYVAGYTLKNPFHRIPFSAYERKQSKALMQLAGFQIPFGLTTDVYFQAKQVEERCTEKEAVELGSALAQRSLAQKLGRAVKILDSQILQQQLVHNKLLLKLKFTVLEDIAVPKAIN